jgi:hypothetical protein
LKKRITGRFQNQGLIRGISKSHYQVLLRQLPDFQNRVTAITKHKKLSRKAQELVFISDTMSPQASDDPFDDLLTLEDTLYTTAHDQGVADGARAGRIEGRIFGLEKGFEKFAALGELYGRGSVWGSRIASLSSATSKPSTSTSTQTPDANPTHPGEPQATPTPPTQGGTNDTATLPPLPTSSTRLQSNITLLYHLTDPLTFSTSNDEPSVADFDDRFKRAGAKAKVIERIIGETSEPSTSTSTSTSTAKSPDRGGAAGMGRSVRLESEKKKGKKGDDSMEDFGGSRLIG